MVEIEVEKISSKRRMNDWSGSFVWWLPPQNVIDLPLLPIIYSQ